MNEQRLDYTGGSPAISMGWGQEERVVRVLIKGNGSDLRICLALESASELHQRLGTALAQLGAHLRVAEQEAAPVAPSTDVERFIDTQRSTNSQAFKEKVMLAERVGELTDRVSAHGEVLDQVRDRCSYSESRGDVQSSRLEKQEADLAAVVNYQGKLHRQLDGLEERHSKLCDQVEEGGHQLRELNPGARPTFAETMGQVTPARKQPDAQ